MKRAALVLLIGCGSSTPKPAPEIPDTATPTPFGTTATTAAPVDAATAEASPTVDRPDGMTLGAEIDRLPPADRSTKTVDWNAYALSYVTTEEDDRTYKVAVDSKIESIYPITAMREVESDVARARYLIRVADPVQVIVDQDQPIVRKDALARSIMLVLPPGVTADLAKGQHVMISLEEHLANFGSYGKTFIKDDKGLVVAIDPPADILPFKPGKKMRAATVNEYEVTVKLDGKQLRSFRWSSQTVGGASYFMYGFSQELKRDQTAYDFVGGPELALLRKP